MMKDHNFWKRKGVFSVLLVCLLGSTNAGYASDPEHAMTSGGTTGTLGVNLQHSNKGSLSVEISWILSRNRWRVYMLY